jgi:competence protein ComEC
MASQGYIPRQIIVFAAGLCFFVAAASCRLCKPEFKWISSDVNTPTVQGDAHLLVSGGTNFVLIDAGPRETTDRLVNCLKSSNCRYLHSVIITHGHRDHYGALVPLINSGISIGKIYFNPPALLLITNELWGCSPEEIAEIQSAAKAKNIPLCAIKTGDEWCFDNETTLCVICAFDGLNTPVGRTDINDTSAIIMLTHEKIKILFAADLNRAVGDYLTTNCPSLLRADILKFPHHGTEGFANDAFFEAVNAKAVIVPASQELWLSERSARARRLTRDCKVFVNGAEGNITVYSDGASFRIESEKPCQLFIPPAKP